MKWKISNTLWVTALFLFIVGVLFNWEQAKKSVNDGLAKARKVKADIAKKKKAEESKSESKKEDLDNTKSSTNGVIKEDGVVKLEEIEIIKSKV
jgi:predicted negative regulator of RcsB-dependent stress response